MTTTQFLAILHYATSRVVPQQTLAKIKISFNILQILVRDHQCLGPVLLGFWVAQIGDGFGGDQCRSRRGHGFFFFFFTLGFFVTLGLSRQGHRFGVAGFLL